MGLTCLEFQQTHSLPASVAFFESLENGANKELCKQILNHRILDDREWHASLRNHYLLTSSTYLRERLQMTDQIYAQAMDKQELPERENDPIINIMSLLVLLFITCTINPMP